MLSLKMLQGTMQTMAIAELATEPRKLAAEIMAEQRFRLRGVDWPTYRRIAEAVTGHHLRLTYDRGTLNS